MKSRFISSTFQLRGHQTSTRRRLGATSRSKQVDTQTHVFAGAVTAVCGMVYWASNRSWQADDTCSSKNGNCFDDSRRGAVLHTTACSHDTDYFDSDFDSEDTRFHKAARFHRSQLERYRKRWKFDDEMEPNAAEWPRRLPLPEDIGALEFDFKFCRNNVGSYDQRYCDNLQFRIASYYLCQKPSNDHGNPSASNCADSTKFSPRRGYYLLKDLADRGHADGMCLYGKILQEGRKWAPEEVGEGNGVDGIEANPNDAVVWWRRAVDLHRQHHLPTLYELGVALYTGEGVPEDTQRAIRYFRKAAEQGHAGAAYMLADGLLHGVGVSRDRAEALDWLVNAAEQGHHEAQRRVFAVLESVATTRRQQKKDDEDDEEELGKWDLGGRSGKANRPVSIERRFTIGGGSRNPAVLARRKTVVDESRKG